MLSLVLVGLTLEGLVGDESVNIEHLFVRGAPSTVSSTCHLRVVNEINFSP
jgi:hypothetical protein